MSIARFQLHMGNGPMDFGWVVKARCPIALLRDMSTPSELHCLCIMSTTNSKLRVAILVISETVSQDPSTDKCIPMLKDVFGNLGNDQWELSEIEIVPDNVLAIQKSIRSWTDGENPINLIVTSGGTGFAIKDVTPEVIELHSTATAQDALTIPRQSVL